VHDRVERSRRTRGALDRPGYGPSRSNDPNPWQAIAIVALIAATAGWTTVALLALREPQAAAVAAPTTTTGPAVTLDPGFGDVESIPPALESHDDPALEAVLPTEVGGIALEVESFDGGTLLSDDEWSATVTDFLTGVDKSSSDLHLAQASDPTRAPTIGIDLYSVDGVDGNALSAAITSAWLGLYPDLVVTETKIGGTTVRRIDFGDAAPTSYVFARGEHAFDVYTDDEDLAKAAIAALDASGDSPSASP
jgi:hypothetical protein